MKNATDAKVSILAIDDHFLIVTGLRWALQNEFANLDFVSASNAADGLELIWSRKFSLVLLDLSLGGRNGLEVLEEIKKHTPETPVLVVSMHPEESYAVRALKAGAAGYLRKDAALKDFPTAVHKVLAGEKYVSEALG